LRWWDQDVWIDTSRMATIGSPVIGTTKVSALGLVCVSRAPVTMLSTPASATMKGDVMCNELTGSEAVYGLLGWLTSRDKPVTFSAKHNAAIAADLASLFCETNKLSEPRENWTDYLTHPKEND